jgi:hypothetical protein
LLVGHISEKGSEKFIYFLLVLHVCQSENRKRKSPEKLFPVGGPVHAAVE